MQSIPSSFSSGWQGKRDERWKRWLELIEQDQNYSRVLFNLPLIPPVRREVLETARRLGTTTEVCRTESPQDQARIVPAPAPGPPEP